jgi:hypothetical protein
LIACTFRAICLVTRTQWCDLADRLAMQHLDTNSVWTADFLW